MSQELSHKTKYKNKAVEHAIAWRKRHPDLVARYQKYYYEKNKPILAHKHKIWRQKNKDHVNQYMVEWRTKNSERMKKYGRDYHAKHRVEIVEKMKRRYHRLKHVILSQRKEFIIALRMEVLKAYGGKCTCCGESYKEFLTVEHINHDGRNDRKRHGSNWYAYLKKKGFPKEGLTLFCMNCNWATRLGHVCPHRNNPTRYPLRKDVEGVTI